MEMIYTAVIVPLLWISITDFRNRTIPNIPLIIIVMLGVVQIITGFISFTYAITGLLCVGLPFLLLACRLEGGCGIGGGDVKLCATIGFVLGPIASLMVISEALILLALCAFIFKKKELPFAPFLLFAYIVVIILYFLFGGQNV